MNSYDFQVTAREARIRANTPGSLAAYERSQKSLAGGVSTALRRAAKPYPMFYSHGDGAWLTDVDGNRFIDYTLAWGPLILGHAPAAVNEMAERIGSSASLVSHHLRLLRAARLLQADRRGRQVFYVVGDEHIRSMLTDMVDHVSEDDAEAEPDAPLGA